VEFSVNRRFRGVVFSALIAGLVLAHASGSSAEADAGVRALHDAILQRDIEAVRRQLDSGVDPDAELRGERPLDRVRFPSTTHREIAAALLDAGAQLDGTRYNPPLGLVVAAADAQPRVVDRLLERGVEVDFIGILPHHQVGMKRFTPLQAAIYVSGTGEHYDRASRDAYRRVVARLLSAGADPMANSREDTTLHHAAQSCDRRIVDAVLRAGGRVDARERYQQRTPLFSAIDGLCPEAAELLLRAGADPDALDSQRRTPLASILGKKVLAREHVEIAKLLLEAGAERPSGEAQRTLERNHNRVAGRELSELLNPPVP